MNEVTVSERKLNLYAWTNEAVVVGKIRGVLLTFHGLGFAGMKDEPGELDRFMGENGVLTVFPYYGPWNWMNTQAIALVDSILDSVYARYGLPPAAPWVSSGGSMGGLSALVYARYATRPPIACAANCPVCDLPFHATERPDLPRTVYQSFAHYDCGLEEAMKRHSPLHLADEMPHIPYLIVHGDADMAVNKAAHSDKLCAALVKTHDVVYLEVPGMAHCDLDFDPAVKMQYHRFILEKLLN